jgi:hypothetical protein
VIASLLRSFVDIPYEGKMLWNGSSQPITLTPARDCPVVMGEGAFDVAYSKVDGCCHYCTRKDE